MSDRAFIGCLLGTAVGDALGLPYEGLSRRRAARLFGPPTRFRFLFGRGMVSDDTEHTVIVAQSLIESAGDDALFERALAKRLKRWFLTLPAGIGMATAKACLKLLLGVSPKRSGVASAGNGPAMRSAILGLFADDDQRLIKLVRLTTRITHTDDKAEMGAFAIALAARCAMSGQTTDPREYLSRLKSLLPADGAEEFTALMESAVEGAESNMETTDFVFEMGLGDRVGGYVYHCVPVVIHCWLTHQHDFRSAMETIISCGGDADTNAAMLGGIVGASVGVENIPAEWIDRLLLFPLSAQSITTLATQLSQTKESKSTARPTSPLWIAALLRNLFFLVVVLLHGFRRLAPPY